MVTVIAPKAFHTAFLCLVRALSVALGAWLAALLPVEILAHAKSSANEVTGHAPNMDPGVTITLGFVVSIPFVAIALVAELFRHFALGGQALSLQSCVALGILSAWPVGFAFVSPSAHFGYLEISLASAMGIVGFYVARWFLLKDRK